MPTIIYVSHCNFRKHIQSKAFTFETRKDVGAECWHDMRPSIQLPSISGADSKLGLTVVRFSLHMAPEPLALDLPPVCKHDARYAVIFKKFLTSSDLDLDLFNWKMALHLRMPWRMFMPILIFLHFLLFFELRACTGKTGQTGKMCNH